MPTLNRGTERAEAQAARRHQAGSAGRAPPASQQMAHPQSSTSRVRAHSGLDMVAGCAGLGDQGRSGAGEVARGPGDASSNLRSRRFRRYAAAAGRQPSARQPPQRLAAARSPHLAERRAGERARPRGRLRRGGPFGIAGGTARETTATAGQLSRLAAVATLSPPNTRASTRAACAGPRRAGTGNGGAARRGPTLSPATCLETHAAEACLAVGSTKHQWSECSWVKKQARAAVGAAAPLARRAACRPLGASACDLGSAWA